jgi:PAS domain S-box-containing protein
MSVAEEQYRALFEQANEGIFIADAKGRFLDVNQAGCLMLGYTTDEITHMTIADIISGDEHGRIVPKMERSNWDKQIHNHWKLIRKDHSVIIGEVKSVMLSDGRLQAIVSNVTEYMQERTIVGKQEEHMRPTLDYMLEGCQIIGFDGRYLYINSAAETQNRRPREELLGKSFVEMWPGIESTEVYKGIKKALEERVPIHLEELFSNPLREEGWFDISIQPVPEGVFILSVDISERKQAEQALLDSEEKYRSVSENTDDWIYWICPEGKFRYISPACEWITGYSAQEFMERPSLYMDIVWPEDKEMVHAHNMESIKGDIPPHSIIFRIINKKGELRWIDHNCTPLFTNGEYKGLIGTNRNITTLKQTEEKLFESELKFRKIFEDGPFGILLVNSEFKTIMANAQASRMLGYTEEELLQRTFRDLSYPEEVRDNIVNVKKLIAGEISVYKTEKRYIRKDGQTIWVSLTVTPNFSDDGQFLYNVAIIEDITRRKQAEEALQVVNERLELATDVSNAGIWDFNLVNNIVYWDDNIYKIYGLDPLKYPPSNDTWLEMIYPDDREFISRKLEEIHTKASRYDLEFRIIRPDGIVRWIGAVGQVFKNIQGKPVRMVGVNYDITSRKQAEEELYVSKTKLETAIESMTDAIVITDDKGRFLQFNEAFATFHKFKNKEECRDFIEDYPKTFVGFYLDGAIVPPEEWPISRALKGERGRNFELIIHRNDTDEKWMASCSYAPIRDANGQITGTVMAGRDITKRKQAEEALRISEERYRNIFESAVIGIYRTTPDGKILMANPTLIKLLGFDSLEELKQRNLEEEGFEGKVSRDEFRRKLEKDGKVTGLESEWKTRDSISLFVSENARAFYNDKGEILYYEGTIEDITERKMIERQLRESEEKFRKAFLINPDSITISRMEDGAFISVNNGFTQIFGYSEEEAIGKTVQQLDIWLDLEERSYHVRKLKSRGIIENWELKLKTKSGNIIDTLASSVIIEVEGTDHILSTIKDVTELNRAGEALKKQEALLKEMGRMAQIGGWEYYPQTGQVIWTSEVARIHDLDPTPEVSLDTALSYYDGNYQEIVKEAVRQAVEKAKPYDLECGILSAKGVKKWVRSIGNPVVEKSKVVKITGSFQDITERKNAEIALRQSEENFRLLIESISLPVAYINEQGVIIFRNNKFYEVFGYTEQEIPTIKEWWLNAFPDPEYREMAENNWSLFVERAMNTRKDTISAEYDIICKDGSVRTIITSGVYINDSILITLIDITERKRVEQEIIKLNASLEKRVEERTFQLMEANRELEAFSYSVSHDLRAPLRHINGFVDLLNQKYKDLLPEKGQHYLRTIVESSEHMGALIDDLLQFSRTGRQEMQHTALEMKIVIHEVLRLLDPDIQSRDIEWKIATLPVVTGDHALLRIVWYNLISNAVKFTKNQQKAIIEIGSSDNDKEYTFFVRDNGAGFDMKYVNKLFGVFQRLHSKTDFEGTGIGLANVRRIIQKHGGRTWAESQLGRGATFYFTLPKIR